VTKPPLKASARLAEGFQSQLMRIRRNKREA
jgi:hypothetical protein